MDLNDKNRKCFSLSCQHYFHKDCFKDVVKNAVREGVSGVVLRCPEDGCG